MQTQTSIQTLICRLSPAQCKSLLLTSGIFIESDDLKTLRGLVREQFNGRCISAIDIRDTVANS